MSNAAMLAMISTMENQLNQMKAALGASTVAVKAVKAVKAKAEKDPNAAPKPPNVWIKFTQQVSAALKAAKIETGAAPVSKQFASTLKDQKAYAEWTDEAIVAAWAGWTKPEVSKMAASKASSSGESSASEGSVAEKPKAKRAAVKAVKPEVKAEVKAEVKPEVKAVEVKAEVKAVEVKAVEVKAEVKPKAKAAPKVVAKKTYTLEQLQDFGEHIHESTEYGLNVRGDLVDTDGVYVGFWDGKAIVKGAKPADWATVMPESE